MGNGFMCDTLGPQTWEAGLGQWFLELHSHPTFVRQPCRVLLQGWEQPELLGGGMWI